MRGHSIEAGLSSNSFLPWNPKIDRSVHKISSFDISPASWIRSTPSYPTSPISLLIISFHPGIVFLPFEFRTRNMLICFLYGCHMPRHVRGELGSWSTFIKRNAKKWKIFLKKYGSALNKLGRPIRTVWSSGANFPMPPWETGCPPNPVRRPWCPLECILY